MVSNDGFLTRKIAPQGVELTCRMLEEGGVLMLEKYVAWFGEYCADGAFYERIIHNIVQCFIEPGHVAVDAGAHSGRYTLPLCEKVGSAGRVYAIEPITTLARQLKAEAPPQLHVIEAAITNFRGKANLYHWQQAETSSSLVPHLCLESDVDVLHVATETLDTIVPESETVRFIKLDIEGAEFDALQGARRILERDRPLVIFEHGSIASATRYSYDISDFMTFWDDLGYVVVDLFGRPRGGPRFQDNSVCYLVAGADKESLELIANLQIPVVLAALQMRQNNY
jgi:FkbM family methyltransferase